MEGYFSLKTYCTLANVSQDTALHRTIRGSVPTIKDENGRQFIYFTDEKPEVPEGYISVKEFADKHHVHKNRIKYWIDRGYFKQDEVIRQKRQWINGKPTAGIFIKADAYYLSAKERLSERNKVMMNLCRPMGYLTVTEFAKEIGKPRYYVSNLIKYKKIDYCRNFKHLYIHKSELNKFKGGD